MHATVGSLSDISYLSRFQFIQHGDNDIYTLKAAGRVHVEKPIDTLLWPNPSKEWPQTEMVSSIYQTLTSVFNTKLCPIIGKYGTSRE